MHGMYLQRELCSTFGIKGYPTVKVGTAGAVLAAQIAPDKSTLLLAAVSQDLPTLVASLASLLSRTLPEPHPLAVPDPVDPVIGADNPTKPAVSIVASASDRLPLRGVGQLVTEQGPDHTGAPHGALVAHQSFVQSTSSSWTCITRSLRIHRADSPVVQSLKRLHVYMSYARGDITHLALRGGAES